MTKPKITRAKTSAKPKAKVQPDNLKQQAADLVQQAEDLIAKAKKRFDALDPDTKKKLAATAAGLALVAVMATRHKKKLAKK
jgi:hypothetical protein